jgi:hypothetical protein
MRYDLVPFATMSAGPSSPAIRQCRVAKPAMARSWAVRRFTSSYSDYSLLNAITRLIVASWSPRRYFGDLHGQIRRNVGQDREVAGPAVGVAALVRARRIESSRAGAKSSRAQGISVCVVRRASGAGRRLTGQPGKNCGRVPAMARLVEASLRSQTRHMASRPRYSRIVRQAVDRRRVTGTQAVTSTPALADFPGG